MFTWNWSKKKHKKLKVEFDGARQIEPTSAKELSAVVTSPDTKKHAKNSKILNLTKQTVKNIEIVTFCEISKARKKRRVRNNISLVTKKGAPTLVY